MKKMKTLIALMLSFLILITPNSIFVFAYGPTNEPITFKDINLFDALIDNGVDENADNVITEEELAKQTSLYLGDWGITDLSGLEYAVGLTELYLNGNIIRNLTAISNLTGLNSLILYSNQISDISALNGLTGLINLDLEGNLISDVSPLSGLTNLQYLDISGNSISDISSWNGLVNLDSLDIGYNNISNINVLSNFTNLMSLDITEDPITSLAALKDLNVMNLYVTLSNITDTNSIKDIVKLECNNNTFNIYKDMTASASLMVIPNGDIAYSLYDEDFAIANSNSNVLDASILGGSVQMKGVAAGSSEVKASIPKYEKEIIISVNVSEVPPAPTTTVEKKPILSQRDGRVGAILPNGKLWEWFNDELTPVNLIGNAKKYILDRVYRCNSNEEYSENTISAAITVNDELWAWGLINNGSEYNEPCKVTDNALSADGTFVLKKDLGLWNWGSSKGLVKVADRVKSYAMPSKFIYSPNESALTVDEDSSLVYLDENNALYSATKVWDDNGGFTYSSNKILENVRYYDNIFAVNDSNELYNITTATPTLIQADVKSVSFYNDTDWTYKIAFVITQNDDLLLLPTNFAESSNGKDVYSTDELEFVANDVAKVEGPLIVKTDHSICGVDYDGLVYILKPIASDVDKVFSNGYLNFFTKADGSLYRIDVDYDFMASQINYSATLVLNNVSEVFLSWSACYALDNNGGLVKLSFDYMSGQWNQVLYLNGVSSVIISDYFADMNYAVLKDGSIWYWGSDFGFDNNIIPVKMNAPELNVEKTEISVSVQSNPTKTVYTKGEPFDVSGGALSVKLNDGTIIEKSITQDICSGYDMNTIGEQVVTVNYNGLSTSFTITVNNAKGDINLDGNVDVLDLLLLKMHLMKIIHLTGNALTAADYYSDNIISLSDYVLLKKDILLSNVPSNPVSADKSTSLTLTPSSSRVRIGDTVTVTGAFSSGVTIGAFDMTVNYDVNQLQFISAEGISPAIDENEINVVDNGNGKIQILYIDNNGGLSPINGTDAFKLNFLVIRGNVAEHILVDSDIKTLGDDKAEPVSAEKAVADMTIEAIPTGSVEDGGFYTSAREITFNSGTATLNGVEVESGTVVSQAGDYILEVKDEAGNKTAIQFTICLSIGFDLVNDKIYNIKANSTVADIISGFVLSDSADIFIKRLDGSILGDNENAGTGMKACISVNGVIKGEYTIVVLGDVSGDGLINAIDLLKMKRSILGYTPLENAYAEAANIDKDESGSITAIDYLKLKRYILGLENLVTA